MNTSEKLQALFDAALRATHDSPSQAASIPKDPASNQANYSRPPSFGELPTEPPAMSPEFRSMLEKGMLKSARG